MSSSNDIKIKITIDGETKNVTLMREEVNKLGNSINNVDTYANALRSTIGKLAAVGFVITGISNAFKGSLASIDAFSNAMGRLKLATKSSEELKALSEQILNISNSSRVSFTETTDLYTRFANNLKNTTISSSKMLEVTKAVSQSLIVSGASANSANAALVQLAQGLAADSLRGQELASVMEQTPRLAQAIADGMGVSIGELRKLAEQGKLTAEAVFNALYKQKDVIEKEFLQMPATISQSMVTLGNSVQNLLGRLNESTGFTKLIAMATNALSSAINAIAPYTQAFTHVIKVLLVALSGYSAYIAVAKLRTQMFSKVLQVFSANSFIASLMSAKTASDAFKIGISASTAALGVLKGAMMRFLPTVGFLIASELLIQLGEHFLDVKEKNERLKNSLALTNEELKKLSINELKLTLVDLQREQAKLIKNLEASEQALNSLDEEISDESIRDEAFRSINAGASKFEQKLNDVNEKIKTTKNLIEELNNPSSMENAFRGASKELDGLLEKYKNIRVQSEIKKDIDQTKKEIEKLNGVRYLDKGLEDKRALGLEKAQKQYGNYQRELSNFNKKEVDGLSALNQANLEVARVGMSERSRKLSEINEKYKKWLSDGVNAKEAAKAKEILIEQYDKEATQRTLKAKNEIYKDYYEKIKDYASLWAIKEAELRQKLKSSGIGSGEIEKMIALSKSAFDKDSQDKARQANIKQINEHLQLKDREFNLQKRQTELIVDETQKRMELVSIEHDHALEQYEAMLKKGEISQEYYAKALALEEQLYQKQMFDASSWGQVAKSTISSLETAMGSFLDYSSDKFMKFGDLAQNILQSLANSLMKMLVIQPIANALTSGIQNYFGGSGGAQSLLNSSGPRGGALTTGGSVYSAQGNVFSSPDLHRYVNSVVSRPTYFKFAKGGMPNLGVMGEKNGGSPEAIIPLTRTSGGDLGVKAQVDSSPNNIKIEVINQTREDVKVTNVSSRQNMEEQVISIVIGAVQTNKMGMRDVLGGGR
ncbi:tape measure protein [Campylobacter curvus]|uniref:tape measure protein n=1 Tax=Campylobacter curvus TaxID=200 RepID=UPI00146FFE6E|nr:tape measure protein [Campylobacter curvus]